MLPPFWRHVSLFNPVVYLVSGFRWSFYEHSDVSVTTSLIMITVFTVAALAIIARIFKTGYRIRK
jgi:ABC-2 type transport system permease protein